MNLTSTDIAAFLGASAWIPQIIKWFHNIFTKPTVSINTEKTVSIGYTAYGPIFNLRLSLNVDKKDTLIDFIGVTLVHEDGSKHNFEWAGMTEIFSQIKSGRGEDQIVQRDITPISIKLSTLSLVERLFKFQDSEFLKTSQPIIDDLFEHRLYMKKNDKNYHDNFLKSKKFDDYLKFMRGNFWWKAGNYKVSFYVRSPVKITFTPNMFEFQLTQDNIDTLMKNLDEIKIAFEYMIKKPDLPEFNGNISNWIWLNPTIKKIN